VDWLRTRTVDFWVAIACVAAVAVAWYFGGFR
jgi:hypothetical protein